MICRRKDDKSTVNETLATTRRGRELSGLDKIRGPEWGITELDFEGDHRTYGNEEMKREYDAAGKVTEPIAYKSSHRPGHQSVSGQAWMQEVTGETMSSERACFFFFLWKRFYLYTGNEQRARVGFSLNCNE